MYFERKRIVNKKILICFLLVSFINLATSCFSLESVSYPEYQKVVKKEGKPDEIYVITKDSIEYYFSDSGFYFENDTLFGKVSEIKVPFEGKFVLSEKDSIDVTYKGNFQSLMTVSEFNEIETEYGKPIEIYLINTDSVRYHFMQDDFYIENDTLHGNGQSIFEYQPSLYKKIALSDIKKIKVDKSNRLNTIFLVIGITAGLLVALSIAFLASGGLSNVRGCEEGIR